MELGEMAAVMTATITGFSFIAMCFQIRSNVRLNRLNETFRKISELDKILYSARSENPLAELVENVGLNEEHLDSIELEEAMQIFKNNKNKVYELLNFFESLSSAALAKNINKNILKQIYGQRIYKSYIKLSPFITIIAHKNNKDPNKRPYQHFELLYKEIDYDLNVKSNYKKIQININKSKNIHN